MRVRREFERNEKHHKTMITEMSLANGHHEGIVNAFIGCLEQHRLLLSDSSFMQREGEFSLPQFVNSSQVGTQRHAVGVIITSQDYNHSVLDNIACLNANKSHCDFFGSSVSHKRSLHIKRMCACAHKNYVCE